MLFVPAESVVKAGVSGYDNLVADALWLSLIQYYGDRYFSPDRQMHNLDRMVGLITDLDPKFWFAYWLGAWALADNLQVDAALRILERGEERNPQEANFPYLQGFIQFLVRSDYPAAAACFLRAAEKPILDWPEQQRFARSMAARMYRQGGQTELALQLWRGLYEQAGDKALRDIAARNVARLEAEITLKKSR
jgi:tetratricopeptide (TPR) repeat protein